MRICAGYLPASIPRLKKKPLLLEILCRSARGGTRRRRGAALDKAVAEPY